MVQFGGQDSTDEAKGCFKRNISYPRYFKIKNKVYPLPLPPIFKIETENLMKVWVTYPGEAWTSQSVSKFSYQTFIGL